MKWLLAMLAVLAFVLLAARARQHEEPAQAAATMAAAGSVAARDGDSLHRGISPAGGVSRGLFGVPLRPAQVAPGGDQGLQMTAADIRGLQAANFSDEPLAALKELAGQGNAFAVNDVGAMLTTCLPPLFRQQTGAEREFQENLQAARDALELARQQAAPATSIDEAEDAVRTSEEIARHMHKRVQTCNSLSLDQMWQGFDWFLRSYAMGNRIAGVSFVATVVAVFPDAAAVGRNPQRAIELRDKARDMLAGLLSDCDEIHLSMFAGTAPYLYRMDPYRRFVLANLMTRHPDDYQALERQLGPIERVAARRDARAMRMQCLGHPLPENPP